MHLDSSGVHLVFWVDFSTNPLFEIFCHDYVLPISSISVNLVIRISHSVDQGKYSVLLTLLWSMQRAL